MDEKSPHGAYIPLGAAEASDEGNKQLHPLVMRSAVKKIKEVCVVEAGVRVYSALGAVREGLPEEGGI